MASDHALNFHAGFGWDIGYLVDYRVVYPAAALERLAE